MKTCKSDSDGGQRGPMVNTVVLIKQVPDTYSERKLTDGTWVLDRDSADAVLDEIDERAIAEALRVKESVGGEVIALTVGPDRVTPAIRKALALGVDRGVHIQDDAVAGSDVIQTGWVIAKALGTIEGVELIVSGNESTDGRCGAIASIISEYLGIPQLTSVRKLDISDSTVTGERETEDGIYNLEASLPAVVSVTEKIGEPRYPSFKGITAAKKKSIEVLSIAQIDVSPEEVGLAHAASVVTSATPAPEKSAGEKIADEGEGGNQIAQYLIGKKII